MSRKFIKRFIFLCVSPTLLLFTQTLYNLILNFQFSSYTVAGLQLKTRCWIDISESFMTKCIFFWCLQIAIILTTISSLANGQKTQNPFKNFFKKGTRRENKIVYGIIKYE